VLDPPRRGGSFASFPATRPVREARASRSGAFRSFRTARTPPPSPDAAGRHDKYSSRGLDRPRGPRQGLGLPGEPSPSHRPPLPPMSAIRVQVRQGRAPGRFLPFARGPRRGRRPNRAETGIRQRVLSAKSYFAGAPVTPPGATPRALREVRSGRVIFYSRRYRPGSPPDNLV
jgi:hypothetical protein